MQNPFLYLRSTVLVNLDLYVIYLYVIYFFIFSLLSSLSSSTSFFPSLYFFSLHLSIITFITSHSMHH